MTVKKGVAATTLYGVSAILVKPLLEFAAPPLKPLLNEVIKSKAVEELLRGIVESTEDVSSNVFSNFVHANANSLMKALCHSPRLDEALIAALIQAFQDMRDDLRKRNRHNILNSFEQCFADWENKLQETQDDEISSREFLKTNSLARVFYEPSRDRIAASDWWPPVRKSLEAWTTYQSISSDLAKYLEENLLAFAQEALTSTLHSQEFKHVWNEFYRSLVQELQSVLEEHVDELKKLLMVSGGQFMQSGHSLDFALKNRVDVIVEKLSAKAIYFQREVVVLGQDTLEVRAWRIF